LPLNQQDFFVSLLRVSSFSQLESEAIDVAESLKLSEIAQLSYQWVGNIEGTILDARQEQ
jgi:hypothetical protein